MKLRKNTHTQIADLHTPVSLYLALRDVYPKSLLLESSDYQSVNNSTSFICLQPISTFKVEQNKLSITGKETCIVAKTRVLSEFNNYINSFVIEENSNASDGLFGYFGYDAVEYFEDITLQNTKKNYPDIPEIQFSFYKFIIKIDHFNDEMTICEYLKADEESQIQKLVAEINIKKISNFPFQSNGEINSNLKDEEYKKLVSIAKQHCLKGDVFQLVLSRRFSTQFKGDDFNVYRALRTINPSPYLYYFDFGNFKLFGSSPESQLKIENNIATLNPIAGTYKRTGNDTLDKELALQLSLDEKENAEHAMLVDLARNDLSIDCKNIKVENYKEVQFFSHVIHLVSKVTGELKPEKTMLQIIANTFPAGTLSGAPKYKALELIDAYENINRSFYGGAVGFIGLNKNCNMAILIRSFLSKNNELIFQAGAGIVKSSTEEGELQEVNNKLEALKKAIVRAESQNLFYTKTNVL